MVAKTTATTITLKQLAAALAADHEIPKKQAEGMLNDLVGMMVKHLVRGERVRIGGFGILQVHKRAARMGRNPATGEPIKIKASRMVAFRAAKELRQAAHLDTAVGESFATWVEETSAPRQPVEVI